MNATSIDVKDMLVAETALGLTFATNLFVGKEPSKPENCVVIFDTPGFITEKSTENKTYKHPSIQVRVINNDYKTGYALAESIETFLLSKSNEVQGGTMYTLFKSNVGVFFMDWDVNDNARFVINFDIQRR